MHILYCSVSIHIILLPHYIICYLGNDYYYTLKDIVVFLANADVADADYRKKVLEMRVTAVVGQDRQPLKSYLNGTIDTCPQIDHQVAASCQVSIPALTSADHSNEPTMSVEKMQEQRERFTAQMEKALQKTKTADTAQDALGSLKQMKRKSQQAFGGEADEEVVDKQLLAADQKILARLRADELPAHTRSTVLNAASTVSNNSLQQRQLLNCYPVFFRLHFLQDFSVVLKLFNDKILKPMQAPTKSSLPAPAAAPGSGRKPAAAELAKGEVQKSATGPAPPSSSGSTGTGKTYPIIIVPASLTTCITMHNVKDFLVDGMYISVEEKRSSGGGKERDTLLIRDLPNNSGRLLYHVIDDPTRLSDAEWNLVVAVFATGQLWQFKGWKYPTPVALFQHVLGIHVCIDSAAVDPNILSWNCRVLKVKCNVLDTYYLFFSST